MTWARRGSSVSARFAVHLGRVGTSSDAVPERSRHAVSSPARRVRHRRSLGLRDHRHRRHQCACRWLLPRPTRVSRPRRRRPTPTCDRERSADAERSPAPSELRRPSRPPTPAPRRRAATSRAPPTTDPPTSNAPETESSTSSGTLDEGQREAHTDPDSDDTNSDTDADAHAAVYPDVMAAAGDSITLAYNAASYGSYPQYSWSTGTASTLNSLLQRLQVASGTTITGVNVAALGANSSDLAGQVSSAIAAQADYLTVEIGANDACTPTVGGDDARRRLSGADQSRAHRSSTRPRPTTGSSWPASRACIKCGRSRRTSSPRDWSGHPRASASRCSPTRAARTTTDENRRLDSPGACRCVQRRACNRSASSFAALHVRRQRRRELRVHLDAHLDRRLLPSEHRGSARARDGHVGVQPLSEHRVSASAYTPERD